MLTAADRKVGVVRVNLVVRLAIVTIMTKLKVACLLEAATLASVEVKTVKGPLPEAKMVKDLFLEVRMVKGHLHLLLIRVVRP